MKNKPNFSETLIALAPALIQVIGFLAVELNDRLKLGDFFIYPNVITVVNIFIVIFVFSMILTFSYWKNKYYSLKEEPTGNKTNTEEPQTKETNSPVKQELASALPKADNKNYKITLKIFIIFTILAGISLFLFIVSILIKATFPENLLPLLGITQWIIYTLLLSSSSFVIYLGLLDKKEVEEGRIERESFNLRVIEKLREAGWVDSPKILYVSPIGIERQVYVKQSNNSTLNVITSWDGKELILVQEVANNLTPIEGEKEETQKTNKKSN